MGILENCFANFDISLIIEEIAGSMMSSFADLYSRA